MIRAAMICAASLALAASVPSFAQELAQDAIELKNLIKGKQTLKEDMGYIFMSMPTRFNAMFIKTPDAEDFEAYEAEWQEAFDKAKEKYARRLKSYESNQKAGRRVGEKPAEPTEEEFSIGDIERRLMVTLGPQYVYDKGKDANGNKYFDYLEELKPGEYTYYGPIFLDPNNGYIGSCYCMGSIKFKVEPGVVTSIGDVLTESWAGDEARRLASAFYEPIEGGRPTKPIDFSVPESLTQLPVVEADFHAAGKINNFFRVGVLRMPPLGGVLRYDRDTVIDVKEELALQAKAKAEAEAAARAKAEAEAAALAKAQAEAAAQAAAAAAEGEGEESGAGEAESDEAAEGSAAAGS